MTGVGHDDEFRTGEYRHQALAFPAKFFVTFAHDDECRCRTPLK
jgi:hypothetical protein